VAKVQARMAEAEIDLLWIAHAADRFYLSGSMQDGVLLVPIEGAAVFHVRKSLERARAESRVNVEGYPGREALAETARAMLGAVRRIGLAMDVTPAATYAWLVERIDDVEIRDLSGELRRMRATKSPWEVEQIRRAGAQATTLFAEVPGHLAPRMTELELSAWVEGRLRQLGHGGTVRVRRPGTVLTTVTAVSGSSALYPTSFDGPVGAEGLYPSAAASAGRKEIRRGETVMLDIVTAHNGYHADDTRTFFLGETVPEAASRAHDFCRAVLARIEERLEPGARCGEIYRDIRRWAERRGEPQGFMGFGENRVKFFGHGVGLELDELPVLAERMDDELRPGMVLAVEPKAFLDPTGHVGLETTYVVTETGCDSLCAAEQAIVVI
jgi:Xaa-Pro aminopeptidase